MTRVLARIAAVLGITAAAATVLVYGVQPTDAPGWRLTRATALVSLPDGGQVYRTLKVPVLGLTDGGLSDLPIERVVSCGLSATLDPTFAPQYDACIDGGLAPSYVVTWVGGQHDTPDIDCADEDVCDGGYGVAIAMDQCAARGWPDAGVCTLSDGGAAPFGVTLQPGTWSGPGCVPRVCVVFSSGGSSVDPGWPDTAPLVAPDGGLMPPRGEGS